MSSRMYRNVPALKRLSKAPKHIRCAILDNASRDLIIALDEAIHNVLMDVVPLNRKQFKKLKKQKNNIYRINDKKSLKTKKQLLIQKGGFLQTLIPPVLALLASLL